MLNHACVRLQPLSNDLVRQPRSAADPGDGERDAEIAWQHGRGVPECPSPVYHDGLIYMIKTWSDSYFRARNWSDSYLDKLIVRGQPANCFASCLVTSTWRDQHSNVTVFLS